MLLLLKIRFSNSTFNPPHNQGVNRHHGFGTQIEKSRTRKALCKNVSKLVIHSDIMNLKIFAKHLLTHKVVINLDMLGSGMKHKIGGNSKSGDIVTPELGSKGKVDVEILQNLTNPTKLCGSGGKSAILRLSGRTRNNVLSLSTPSNGVEPKVNQKPSGGVTVKKVSSPI